MRRVLVLVSLFLFVLCVVVVCVGQNKPAKITAVELSKEITPPRLLEVASPEYTPEAKKKRIEGEVALMIVVNEKGDVTEAKVTKGLGYGLDENAVEAVKVWRYKPAEKDGEPIAVKMEVTTSFVMKD